MVKLYEGNEYKFRVSAENRVGVSDPCETKELVKCKLPYGECAAATLISAPRRPIFE